MTRLGVDRIDIASALIELREQGVLSGVGLGMNFADVLTTFVRRSDVDTLMVAGRYTLLEQPALDELLPLCAARGVGVVAAGVYNSGILASPTPGTTYNYAEAPAELVEKARRIAAVCSRFEVELPAAAIAFAAAHPVVRSVVLGASSVRQVASNAARAAVEVPPALWRALVDEGLLRPDAPVVS
jgi:D-threo-aldose 1-dehydrogenase